MRTLVTGASGQLGTELVRALKARGDEVIGLTSAGLDISDEAAVRSVLGDLHPELIINAAAWTAVDDAETHEAEALRVNGHGPRWLARWAGDAWLVQVSTDYVFDGSADHPYRTDDEVRPRSAYGRTKLAGEEAVRAELPDRHWIVRTAWLYGITGSNFPKTIMRLADERDSLSVVDDQRGQPTYARDLARQILRLADVGPPAGTFHGTNSGECSWYEFSRAVLQESGRDPSKVHACTSAEFPRPAPRPAYSVLDGSCWERAGIAPMRSWLEALAEAIADGLRP